MAPTWPNLKSRVGDTALRYIDATLELRNGRRYQILSSPKAFGPFDANSLPGGEYLIPISPLEMFDHVKPSLK
jgi:hypothetical protein